MPDYTRLAERYDEIFPASAAEMAFVAARLGPAGRLLDIGCGTGNKTVLLAAGRDHVVGIDADAGIIAAARTGHPGPNIRYDVLDMSDLAARFSAHSFDAAVSLGNTLAHLPGPADLTRFFESLRRVLVPGGRFIGQILHYDRILDAGMADLPRIETDSVVFTRRYERRDGEFHFVSDLLDKADGTVDHGDTVLFPFRKSAVESCLAESGFAQSRCFGGHDGADWTPSSYHFIFDTTSP
ncbi:MAG: class I SAM-dependent methyltransferase [Planctomycetaceae bacterium]|nr:class I SAM-dependent methyltransferase [Planctomycetaceae bacterium]